MIKIASYLGIAEVVLSTMIVIMMQESCIHLLPMKIFGQLLDI